MTITSDSLSGRSPRRKPKKVSPQRRKAQALLNSIDTGMTLTRFQIEAADKFAAEEEVPMEVEHFVKTAVFALSSMGTTDSDNDKVTQIAIALESLALAVDLLDCDLEDVATEALNDL